MTLAPVVRPASTSTNPIISAVATWVGTPYAWGRATKGIGTDCSGMVQGVFASLGVPLPRTSYLQATSGAAVPTIAQAQPGDLIFFNAGEGPNSHVGIYAGNGLMYDAPHSGTTVGLHSIAGYGPITAIRRVAAMPTTQAPTMSFAQLENLWTSNGGNAQLAPTMAAIALAESGGNPQAVNNNANTGDYSVGLWQINYFGNLGASRTKAYGSPDQLLADPNKQAQAAIDLAGNGSGLRNWTTYTSGTYSRYLSGNALLSSPTATLASANTTGAQGGPGEHCLVSFPGVQVPFIGAQGAGCLVGTPMARAIGGALLIGPGLGLMLVGAILVAKGSPAATGVVGAAVGAVGAVGGPPAKLASAAASGIGSRTGRDRSRPRGGRSGEAPLEGRGKKAPRAPSGNKSLSQLDKRLERQRRRPTPDQQAERTDAARERGRQAAREAGPFVDDDEAAA